VSWNLRVLHFFFSYDYNVYHGFGNASLSPVSIVKNHLIRVSIAHWHDVTKESGGLCLLAYNIKGLFLLGDGIPLLLFLFGQGGFALGIVVGGHSSGPGHLERLAKLQLLLLDRFGALARGHV